ncbi:phosphatase PAP2 family protein [Tepidiforma sp.]|uniref:phosphatase PAP2 family protein n=1 Tax=Tepidiforma sp. TaxID=2682230 RepID=UPI002ADE92B7|nr:phosphatase PAP2 family protein [Tepidiforma sp.]
MARMTSIRELPERARRPGRAAALVVRELGIMLVAVLAYFAIRGLTEGARADALVNAARVVDIERALGIHVEEDLQDLILQSHALITLANWVYIWGHWPFIAVVAAWLVLVHPGEYRVLRNAFLVSGSAGLVVFALFPVAPPRLYDGTFVDTVTEYSRAYRVLQPPALVNQYAALPSFHFGWNLLIGLGIVRCAPWRWLKAVGIVAPAAMGLATILTANHYLLDLVVGAAMALAALYAVELARGRRFAPWQLGVWLQPAERVEPDAA